MVCYSSLTAVVRIVKSWNTPCLVATLLSLNYVNWSLSKLFPLLLSVFCLSHAAIQKTVGFVKAGVPNLGRVRINVWSPRLVVAQLSGAWVLGCSQWLGCSLTGCAWHSDALYSKCCWFGQTSIFLVFWQTLRLSWRCAGVESKAGRILLVCRNLIPGTRMLSKKPPKKPQWWNEWQFRTHFWEVYDKWSIKRLHRTLRLKAIEFINTKFVGCSLLQ